ncbi:hypothetical protein [Listeria cornellensis]|nr:hypothetical protein [Listeria cornellensis]
MEEPHTSISITAPDIVSIKLIVEGKVVQVATMQDVQKWIS